MTFPTEHFVSGSPALDFVNTVGGIRSGEADDYLRTYADLADWAVGAGVLPLDTAERLKRSAEADPAAAAAALATARRLRESLHELFESRVRWREAPQAAVADLNQALTQAMTHRRLIRTGAAYALGWNVDDRDLDAPWWEAARAGSELLTSDRLERLKECGSHVCGWLFLDTSKNRSRSWCDMKGCGNRAKARRRRERLNAAS